MQNRESKTDSVPSDRHPESQSTEAMVPVPATVLQEVVSYLNDQVKDVNGMIAKIVKAANDVGAKK